MIRPEPDQLSPRQHAEIAVKRAMADKGIRLSPRDVKKLIRDTERQTRERLGLTGPSREQARRLRQIAKGQIQVTGEAK